MTGTEDLIQQYMQMIKALQGENEKLSSELDWFRTYGQYVAQVNRNVDAEACGYADGDEEYEENFDNDNEL